MAGSIIDLQTGNRLQHGRPSSGVSAAEALQGISWVPVALSAALIVSGLAGRKTGAVAIALAACAAIAVASGGRVVPLHRGITNNKEKSGTTGAEPEVERSITIGSFEHRLVAGWSARCAARPNAAA
ncbi:hypothetical protein [Caballeronia grimmiae]|uniref:Uncharacterized protein n=1 Tax=Caballeronia grimmiae TaxID=1071679 RepID=A0A069NCF6_9BURK|nr:hypothetical protein [Caballeronia grimmiae]KDR25349.1 hypothetical protein BG57_30675 [Caballeronia grimmiae]GGD74560.1 hypothetical protein GCM10010985_31300 [Caballeronia grimmiae]